MRRTAALLMAVGAAAGARMISSPQKEIIPGEYVVVMRGNATEAEHSRAMSVHGGVHRFKRVVRGFTAKLDEAGVQRLLAEPSVESVGHNVRVYLMGSGGAGRNVSSRRSCPDSQSEPVSWGQVRTTVASAGDVSGTFHHDKQWGAGVDIYVTDTGSRCEHEEFTGRCTCGPDCSGFFGNCKDGGGCSDGNGHGTYCASIAAGSRYGIAKSASVTGVKVMSDSGTGSLFGILAGFDYVVEQAEASGRPSVLSCSLGTLGANVLMDNAADNVVKAGVFMSIAAGNSGENPNFGNTCTGSSPGAAELPVTVGSTTLGGVPSKAGDQRSSFSNYGACVDVFAPGSDITAAWVPGNSDYNSASGTSAACPHVSGVAAALLGRRGRTRRCRRRRRRRRCWRRRCLV
eukprot:TRINITY_DN352_c0_g2_i3.p1 TRINITY_DN352_c0_g2~~TRINITY_DN352_c0_g2_i3.p1  ORF type:complete len:401 (+),score=127.02 TRINITY_DN352_c0_g2_i3:81-1283(+)